MDRWINFQPQLCPINTANNSASLSILQNKSLPSSNQFRYDELQLSLRYLWIPLISNIPPASQLPLINSYPSRHSWLPAYSPHRAFFVSIFSETAHLDASFDISLRPITTPRPSSPFLLGINHHKHTRTITSLKGSTTPTMADVLATKLESTKLRYVYRNHVLHIDLNPTAVMVPPPTTGRPSSIFPPKTQEHKLWYL